jgi:hypothetical protein
LSSKRLNRSNIIMELLWVDDGVPGCDY